MMPQIETWSRLPVALREHLVERMRDRNISLADLNLLRLWIESNPCRPFQRGSGTKISARSSFAEKGSSPL